MKTRSSGERYLARQRNERRGPSVGRRAAASLVLRASPGSIPPTATMIPGPENTKSSRAKESHRAQELGAAPGKSAATADASLLAASASSIGTAAEPSSLALGGPWSQASRNIGGRVQLGGKSG